MDTRVLGRGLGCPPLAPAAPPQRAAPRQARRACVAAAASRQETERDAKAGKAAGGQEIYIGFEKGDYDRTPGRKGRVVSDDPSKYPDRSAVTGGWAGGEVGLKEWVKEAPTSQSAAKAAAEKKRDAELEQQRQNLPAGEGKEIYLGFGKDEIELRKRGGKGRFIRDDPTRYPGKEDLGLFSGVTGGFAGGEKGVKEFVKSGNITISAEPTREFSPIVIASVVAGGVTTGAILLNSGVLLTEEALSSTASSQGITIDDSTRLLLNLALALVGVGTLVLSGRAVVKRFQSSAVQLKEDAVNAGRVAIFWLGVLIAALYILQSQ